MRFTFALAAAQSMGLFLSSSEAFTPTAFRATQLRSLTSVRVGGLEDWEDNEDFLKSLAGKNPAAGDDLPADNLEGAELTEDMREKMKKDDETYGGGSRFKEMMEKAQKNKASNAPPAAALKNPFADNPFAGIEGLDPAASPAASEETETPSFDNMTVEQQAQMFRAMMQGQQPAAPDVPLQPVRPPRPDRKVGRNRDADAIQNTADVYFAQLKRDSTVRGIARLRGETEKSNAVFEDEQIEELNNLITLNPHLAQEREEEKKLIETATEEMNAFQKAQEVKVGNPSSTGVSYKEKLAQRRKKQAGGAAAAPPAPVAPAEPPVEPKSAVETPVEPKVEEPVVAAAAPEQPVAQAAHEPPLVEKPVAAAPVEPVVAAAPEPSKPTPAPATPQQSTPSVIASSGPDEIRKGIRTLMGLILKHRGGPGFGTGGLKGAEIGQYEQLMQEVKALLKEEAQSHHTGPTAEVAQAAAAVAPAAPAPPAGDTAGLATVPSSPSGAAQVDSMLACIEGAILMYRNSPEELKEGVLMTVRAALLSAVNTCNKVMGQNEGIPSTGGAGSNVDSMLACVEGAIQMYRNSPPELQQGVLLTVRAALLSAVGTCNKIIAENDVQNFQQYQEATAGMETPSPASTPAQFYDVVPVPDQPEAASAPAAPSAPIGNDANSVVLENIYNKLEAAAGDGKMGLREDLTSVEATDLADSLVEMRSIMMDELDNGISEVATAGAAASGDSASSDSGSTTSMYQKMLAKARADKEANA